MTIQIIIFIFGVAICCYILGYTTAESRERKAKRELQQHIRALNAQKGTLTDWVRANWPNEYAAYVKGHAVGYQQGVLQGPDLDKEQEP